MKHWTRTDFEHWLYGLREEDQHLDRCPECRAEMERLRAQRRQAVAEPEVSREFLAAQRRRIYQRMGEPRHQLFQWRWALSAAMLLLMAIGAAIEFRHKTVAPALSDEQLFSDLASMEERAEPKAIQPMHNLFEE